MPHDLIDVAIRYGLPTVLLFLVCWAYFRLQEKRDADRAAWDKEREKLVELRFEEADSRVEQANGFSERALKMQETNLAIVSKANEMVAQSAQRERELRDEMKAMRDSASHTPGGWTGKR